MFQELMPLLAQRTLCITISRKAVDEICLNVIPKRLKEGENEALSTPLSVTGSPKELDEKLPQYLGRVRGHSSGTLQQLAERQ